MERPHAGPTRFVALLLDDPVALTRTVDAMLTGLAEPGTRVVRVGNPLRSPLTLDRMLIQLAGTEHGIDSANPAAILHAVAGRRAQENRVVLLIEQADTLDPGALRMLQATIGHAGQADGPALQVVFAGRQAFQTLLTDELAPLRASLAVWPGHSAGSTRTEPPVPPPVPSVALVRPVVMEVPAAPPAPARRRGRALPALAVVAVGLLAGAFGLRGVLYRDTPARPVLVLETSPAVAPQPAPAPNEPLQVLPRPDAPPTLAIPPAPPATTVTQAPAPTPEPAPIPAPQQPVDDATRLRREFGSFLDASGQDLAAMTEAQRAGLFDEFVAWRNAASTTPAIKADGPRIVIHAPPAAQAFATRLVAGLVARPGTVELRTVPRSPAAPTIRFYHPEDEAAARRAGGWMADTGLPWVIRDFSTYVPRPAPGTIEVWLPSR